MEFIYGGVVGLTQTLVGFPFDTLKTRRQAFPDAKLDFKTLYRGVGYPMVSTCLLTSNNFGFAAFLHRQGYSWWQGGFAAGFLSAFLITPLEMRKVNRQVGLPAKNVKAIPLHRGLGVTVAREAPAHAVYFGVYHWAKKEGFHPLCGGAFAGLGSWTATYPLDAIKSRMLADPSMTLSQAIAISKFWRGFSLAATRAVLVNSLAFWMYETLHAQ